MIHNEPTLRGGIIDLNRAQVEQRAAVYGFIYQQALETAENPALNCKLITYQLGVLNTRQLPALTNAPVNAGEFVRIYFNALVLKTYEINIVEAESDSAEVVFHYCPLVAMWKRMNFTDQQLEVLCDIAMEADRAAAEGVGLKAEITDTIAKGHGSCKMKFYK